MTERQRINHFVREFKYIGPPNPDSCRKKGFRLAKNPFKDGAYREVYKVIGLPLVIKFPGMEEGGQENIIHAVQEWIAYNKIKHGSKWSKLKKYLPTIYYFDLYTGISIMRYYEVLPPEARYPDKPNTWDKSRKRLEERIKKIYRRKYVDVNNDGNIAKDKNGQLKIIDLGCFEGW